MDSLESSVLSGLNEAVYVSVLSDDQIEPAGRRIACCFAGDMTGHVKYLPIQPRGSFRLRWFTQYLHVEPHLFYSKFEELKNIDRQAPPEKIANLYSQRLWEDRCFKLYCDGVFHAGMG